MAEIFAVRADNLIDVKTFDFLLSCVGQEKRERILKQRLAGSRNEMLIGEILAMYAVNKKFGIPASLQNFICDSLGKPYIEGYENVHFNISHSEGCVICAVSDKPCGADVQKIRKYNSRLAQRVCSDEELSLIENSSDCDAEFIRLWTCKEAALKKKGTGMAGADIKTCTKNENIQSFRFDEYYISVCE